MRKTVVFLACVFVVMFSFSFPVTAESARDISERLRQDIQELYLKGPTLGSDIYELLFAAGIDSEYIPEENDFRLHSERMKFEKKLESDDQLGAYFITDPNNFLLLTGNSDYSILYDDLVWKVTDSERTRNELIIENIRSVMKYAITAYSFMQEPDSNVFTKEFNEARTEAAKKAVYYIELLMNELRNQIGKDGIFPYGYFDGLESLEISSTLQESSVVPGLITDMFKTMPDKALSETIKDRIRDYREMYSQTVISPGVLLYDFSDSLENLKKEHSQISESVFPEITNDDSDNGIVLDAIETVFVEYERYIRPYLSYYSNTNSLSVLMTKAETLLDFTENSSGIIQCLSGEKLSAMLRQMKDGITGLTLTTEYYPQPSVYRNLLEVYNGIVYNECAEKILSVEYTFSLLSDFYYHTATAIPVAFSPSELLVKQTETLLKLKTQDASETVREYAPIKSVTDEHLSDIINRLAFLSGTGAFLSRETGECFQGLYPEITDSFYEYCCEISENSLPRHRAYNLPDAFRAVMSYGSFISGHDSSFTYSQYGTGAWNNTDDALRILEEALNLAGTDAAVEEARVNNMIECSCRMFGLSSAQNKYLLTKFNTADGTDCRNELNYTEGTLKKLSEVMNTVSIYTMNSKGADSSLYSVQFTACRFMIKQTVSGLMGTEGRKQFDRYYNRLLSGEYPDSFFENDVTVPVFSLYAFTVQSLRNIDSDTNIFSESNIEEAYIKPLSDSYNGVHLSGSYAKDIFDSVSAWYHTASEILSEYRNCGRILTNISSYDACELIENLKNAPDMLHNNTSQAVAIYRANKLDGVIDTAGAKDINSYSDFRTPYFNTIWKIFTEAYADSVSVRYDKTSSKDDVDYAEKRLSEALNAINDIETELYFDIVTSKDLNEAIKQAQSLLRRYDVDDGSDEIDDLKIILRRAESYSNNSAQLSASVLKDCIIKLRNAISALKEIAFLDENVSREISILTNGIENAEYYSTSFYEKYLSALAEAIAVAQNPDSRVSDCKKAVSRLESEIGNLRGHLAEDQLSDNTSGIFVQVQITYTKALDRQKKYLLTANPDSMERWEQALKNLGDALSSKASDTDLLNLVVELERAASYITIENSPTGDD